MSRVGNFAFPELHVRIDNTRLAPTEGARPIVERVSLPRVPRR